MVKMKHVTIAHMANVHLLHYGYRQTSNMKRTKFQNLVKVKVRKLYLKSVQ